MQAFDKVREGDHLITFGLTQHLAGILGDHPASVLMGLEAQDDGKGINAIIGLNGKDSSGDSVLSADLDVLRATYGWSLIRAQEAAPAIKGILNDVIADLNPVLTAVYEPGGVTNGTYRLAR
jgi:hypothetical protein